MAVVEVVIVVVGGTAKGGHVVAAGRSLQERPAFADYGPRLGPLMRGCTAIAGPRVSAGMIRGRGEEWQNDGVDWRRGECHVVDKV